MFKYKFGVHYCTGSDYATVTGRAGCGMLIAESHELLLLLSWHCVAVCYCLPVSITARPVGLQWA